MKNNRHLLFLLCAILTADAGTDGISPEKKRMMNLHLRALYPRLDLHARWAKVSRALRGMPEITDGIVLMKLVERQSVKLAAVLDEAERREAMLTLLDVAVAGGSVPLTVERILRTAARPLGFADVLTLPKAA